MNKAVSLLKWIAAILVIAYSGICVYFYYIQDQIIFRPSALPQDYTYSYDFPYEERYFFVNEEVKIHAIHARTENPKGLVLYFHGNRGSNNTNPDKFELFLTRGYDVLYPDYRSFGKSSGELTNGEDLVADMKVVYREMMKEYEQDQIIVLGYSLGSGFAAQVAASFDPKSIVIWTPYLSMIDMKDAVYPFLPDFLVRFPLRTDEALQQIEEPVYIFYAEEDEVLPVKRSIRLNDYLKESDKYFILKRQGHGRIYRNNDLLNEMSVILGSE
ncbi:alpha/beta hydrolase [Balneola sp. MJW-20]|uniref:alpha/beta hydrolase n=1 Tax=Gracilimonas aurantiaca TaxID=3234185 RepID=UPI00346666F1